MKGFVLGVDVGTGGSRAVAMDADGRVVARAGVDHPVHGSRAVGEADPDAWLQSVVGAINSFDGTPAAIGFGGQGPTTVAAADGVALTFRYPIGDIGDPVDQQVAHARELRERLGVDPDPMLLWDWLAVRLGAKPGFQTVWPADPVIPGFGDPVPVGTSVGTTATDSGVAAGIALVPASNDGYLTSWAAGMEVVGRGVDPGGRTGGLGVAVVAGQLDMPYGIPSAVPGIVVAGGPTASHGAMLDWWAGITGTSISELLVAAERQSVGSDGVFVLPFLEGERAPRWNAGLRADILGLRPHHDAGTVTRAILECTAYGLRHIADELARSGATMDRLVSCGRPSTSHLWVSIKSSVLGVPVDVPDEPEMSAYGAALAAGSALGWWPPPGEGRPGDWPLPPFETVEMAPNHLHTERFERFVELGDQAEERLG